MKQFVYMNMPNYFGYRSLDSIDILVADDKGNHVAYDREWNKLGVVTSDIEKIISQVIPVSGWEYVHIGESDKDTFEIMVEPIFAFAINIQGFFFPLTLYSSTYPTDNFYGVRQLGEENKNKIFYSDGEYSEEGFLATYKHHKETGRTL